jgi:hypothetical protein
MLGGQIKVALLNTAQSTSVQYTTVDLDLHTLVLASKLRGAVAPPWPLLRTEKSYITLRKITILWTGGVPRPVQRTRYRSYCDVRSPNVECIRASGVFANGSPNSPQDQPHLLTYRTTHTAHRSQWCTEYTARTPVSAFAIPHVSAALSRLVSSSSLKHINKEHRPLVAPPRLR